MVSNAGFSVSLSAESGSLVHNLRPAKQFSRSEPREVNEPVALSSFRVVY